MTDFIIVGILLICIGLAAAYIVKEKKKGRKCLGCPGGCSGCTYKDGCGTSK